MNEIVRLQVLDDSTEHEWKDVGNKTGDQSIPVNVTSISGNQTVQTQGLYEVNNFDNCVTTPHIIYIGEEDKNGTWKIGKIDITVSDTPIFTYASINNNPTLITYATAWAARATTVVYNIFSVAF